MSPRAGDRAHHFYSSPWHVNADVKKFLADNDITDTRDVECPECHFVSPAPAEWELTVCPWCGLCFETAAACHPERSEGSI